MAKRIAVLVSGAALISRLSLTLKAVGKSQAGRSPLYSPPKMAPTPWSGRLGAGIPACVLPRRDYPTHADYTHALTEKLKALNIDLVVLAGFMHILTGEIIAAYPNAILNVHPALIPSFCGAGFYGLHVHERALEYGVKVTGATVHFVTEEPDGGPIVLQKAVEIREGDTPEALQRRVMEQAEWELLPQAVSLFCQGRLRVEGRTVHIS